MIINSSNTHILNVMPVNAGLLHTISQDFLSTTYSLFLHSKKVCFAVSPINARWTFKVTDIINNMNTGIRLNLCKDNPLHNELPLTFSCDCCFNFGDSEVLSTPIYKDNIEELNAVQHKDKVFV